MPIFEKAFVLLQYALPHHFLSQVMGRVTHCRNWLVKNLLIQGLSRILRIDLKDAENPDLKSYTCFNDFFTRPLKAGARPISQKAGTVVSPADGFLSQAGVISGDSMIQAKGMEYSAMALLGGDTARAAPFVGGVFATVYLSPRDYHRLHMPLKGTLREMVHVPGKLFSVNNATARGVPNLFARNERVVSLFETEAGPMALVLVGAIFVSSIEVVWQGVVTPPTTTRIRTWNYMGQNITLERGQEMGRFNMGSTIIVLFGKETVKWLPSLRPGDIMRVGSEVGEITLG